jgi:hypothetical protein
VQDTAITFEDYEVLYAPYVHDPDGNPIFWKKEIRVQVGPYKGKGFVGILKDIMSYQDVLAALMLKVI